MIIGIGTDIVQIERFNLREKVLDEVAGNILGDDEWCVYQEIENKPAYLAKQFAAKEACIKATGVLVPVSEIQILRKPSGAPYAVSECFGDYNIHLTISDEREYAVAFALAETL